tara:strand:- start:432 stop:590 length:159 start_codon:yes stop_codon:yes gene_type:complete
MNRKTMEFYYGICFGLLIGFIIYATMGTPLGADTWVRGEVKWKPLYVVVVEE